MTRLKLRKLAKELGERHRLYGWKFHFDNLYCDTIAACNNATTTIWVNEFYLSKTGMEFANDQILHEIAHALLPAWEGHGSAWRNKCVEIGAIPHECSCRDSKEFMERFYDDVQEAPMLYNLCGRPVKGNDILHIIKGKPKWNLIQEK